MLILSAFKPKLPVLAVAPHEDGTRVYIPPRENKNCETEINCGVKNGNTSMVEGFYTCHNARVASSTLNFTGNPILCGRTALEFRDHSGRWRGIDPSSQLTFVAQPPGDDLPVPTQVTGNREMGHV